MKDVSNLWHACHKWNRQPLCVACGRLAREQGAEIDQQIGRVAPGEDAGLSCCIPAKMVDSH